MSINLVNVIFGMKVRQARTEADLTLTDFAAQCDLSPSYVTDIEKGRKYPRADKIMRIAEVLGKEYDDLVSIKLPPSLTYLESTLSSAILRRFPFAEFGFEPGDLVTMLTREPDKASALLHAVLDIGRRYDLQEAEFLRAALRSYQEMNENYAQELEDAALAFTAEFADRYSLSSNPPVALLRQILTEVYGYELDDDTIAESAQLQGFRCVFVPGKRPKLYVNGRLTTTQIKFLLAREIGYQYLQLKERSLTSTPHEITSFQQILNDFRAAYFGGALLMPRAEMLADLQQIFAMSAWDERPFLDMLTRYDVTPEMLFYRFSELIPEFFGIKFHFLRFHKVDSKYRLYKQLNMNRLPIPSGIGLHEHYCRRWLSIRLLEDFPLGNGSEESLRIGVQMSEFVESGDKFLCIGFSRPLRMMSDVGSSVIVGFRVDAELGNIIRFANDPAIPQLLINETCERCRLTADQCQDRAAPPTILQAEAQDREIKVALNQLMG
ncbi:MAG: ImmA/IrrE family metallo-endopeptidase [Ardenticatenaceae bacterium]|nr:ImmA/IrrE family metallo-endopeptidase [Ardenticatenaceae bacterium]